MSKKIIEKLRIDSNYYGDFGSSYFSNSDLKNLTENTFKKFHVKEPENLNMLKGKYLHTYLLEKNKLDTFPIWKDSESRGVKYKQWLEDLKIEMALKVSEVKELEFMVKSTLERSEDLKDIITNKENLYEEPMVGKLIENKYKFKAKADIISKRGFIVDIKTTGAESIDDWIYVAKNRFHYDTQAYIYSQLFNMPLVFVVINKNIQTYGRESEKCGENYHEVYFVEVSRETLFNAYNKIEKAMNVWEKYYGPNATTDVSKLFYKTTF